MPLSGTDASAFGAFATASGVSSAAADGVALIADAESLLDEVVMGPRRSTYHGRQTLVRQRDKASQTGEDPGMGGPVLLRPYPDLSTY